MSTPVSILIVDDEVRNLAVLESILYSSDYRLQRATSADEALLALVHGDFAVLVLDINMPQDDGFVLLDHIRGHTSLRKTPAIMCTGSNHDLDRSHARLLGAVGYVLKPASLEGMRGILESLPLFDLEQDEAGLRLMTVAPDPTAYRA